MRRTLTLVDGESLNEYFAKLTKINDIVKYALILLTIIQVSGYMWVGSIPEEI